MKHLVMSIKDLHRGMSLLRDVGTSQNFLNGQPGYLEIRQQRYVVDIPDIQLELLRPADGISAMALRPARDSRSYFMPSSLLR